MKIAIILGIVALLSFSVWYYKRVSRIPNHPHNIDKSKKIPISTEADTPVSFGYKCMWLAVKTDTMQKLAERIGLQNPQECNWKSGIENAYSGSVFIAPAIDNWTLAIGLGLSAGDSKESLADVKELLSKLSKEFGEAQFFCTHRVVEYHCWVKSTYGNIDRVYSYLGERGETIEVFGEPTNAEKAYKLVNTFSEEAQSDDYWDNEGLVYPDEELVMRIAGNWSIDPTLLDSRKDIEGLGLVGKMK